MPIDPVCGMEINEDEAQARSRYRDKTYYFCSESCKAEFERNPEEYVERSEPQEEAA